jgi:hypothetical protein
LHSLRPGEDHSLVNLILTRKKFIDKLLMIGAGRDGDVLLLNSLTSDDDALGSQSAVYDQTGRRTTAVPSGRKQYA